jgi:hypothetical protein
MKMQRKLSSHAPENVYEMLTTLKLCDECGDCDSFCDVLLTEFMFIETDKM